MALAGDEVLAPGLERLKSDLASGRWDRRFGHLRQMDEMDLGYVLLIHEAPR